jgi:hypothetical protein
MAHSIDQKPTKIAKIENKEEKSLFQSDTIKKRFKVYGLRTLSFLTRLKLEGLSFQKIAGNRCFI